MLKVIIPIAIALAIIIGCVIYLNVDFTLNKGEEDVAYNGIKIIVIKDEKDA